MDRYLSLQLGLRVAASVARHNQQPLQYPKKSYTSEVSVRPAATLEMILSAPRAPRSMANSVPVLQEADEEGLLKEFHRRSLSKEHEGPTRQPI
jgi:hypothetical protein